ncbi:protein ALP1-like [Arachis duranensis]|uniref:Protein ALP1-like n=1 Tax=Arachis duranensis TaxID=130453 RepID=A0A9C6TJS4_ARADU|nr:protein ALP1-like [Arachis duranensis]
MVAIFLHIIAHDVKIRVIKRQFVSSEETISRWFNDVLLANLRCHNLLLKKPQPLSQDRMDERWKWFKNFLGALDGTHIKVNVLEADKPRYQNRKGDITTNVLGVVAPDMQFIYVLAGWEGSAADSRVLQDALFRNEFSVFQGHYYLRDAGYMNCEGFLAPYRGQKYHKPRTSPLKIETTRNPPPAVERCKSYLALPQISIISCSAFRFKFSISLSTSVSFAMDGTLLLASLSIAKSPLEKSDGCGSY